MGKRNGFTLMELMIVIAIIIILAGAIVARFGTGAEKAKIAKARAEVEEIASGIRAFRLDCGVWPPSDYDWYAIGSLLNNPQGYNGYDDSGNRIVISSTVWKGPYLEAATYPCDPWGSQYVAIAYPANNPTDYRVYSRGPNRGNEKGEGDDIKVIVHVFRIP